MSRNQLMLHYNFYCPTYRKMCEKDKKVFIDRAVEFQTINGYVPEFWEIKS